MMTRRTIAAIGLYTDAHRTLYLDADNDALHELAVACRLPGSRVMALRQSNIPSEEYSRLGRIALEVRASSPDRVAITRQQTTLTLRGGSRAMGLLADTLDDLSALPSVRSTGVASHVDLSYFEGGGLLEDTGYGLTVTLVNAEVAANWRVTGR